MKQDIQDLSDGTEKSPLYSGVALSEEQTSSRWDERTWGTNILNFASVKGSKVKLERRVAEFLSHADSTERADFEIGRTNLLIAMSAAEREYTKKHAETSPEIEQHKVQAAKAKIKAGCKAFSAVAYEYSQIMDVLATQAPEYVALAWGAVKIVLVVQINHEELKIKVKEHMDLIRSRFEVINHLTAYNPRQNLVRAVAKAYELFSRFLAKAVKYYSMTKLKATWKAFSQPWKIRLQALVDEIDQTCATIKDIAQYHGLLEGHANLVISQRNLINSQQTIAMQAQSLARLDKLEDMMAQVHATLVHFSKEQDVHQTANLLQQRVDEILQSPEKQGGSTEAGSGREEGSQIDGIEQEIKEAAPRPELEDLAKLRDEVFLELRDYHLDISRRERVIEQAPEMREYRSKVRNMMKIDKFVDWVYSDTSQLLWIDANGLLRRSDFNVFFAAPMLVIGESNYDSTLILRHFCDENASHAAKGYSLLVQALLYQIFQQNVQVFKRKRRSLTRECTANFSALWSLFLECLEEVDAHCTFIIIDSIDAHKIRASDDTIEEGNLLVEKLTALVQDGKSLVKILLTASLTKDQVSSSDDIKAVTLPRQMAPFAIAQDELKLIPHKLSEIHERRCKTISFAELPLLYSSNTTIYTFEDREVRAFVVAELKGMDPLSSESYSPLEIRAWSVDHNGIHLARRYHYLRVRQFSGQRAVTSLQYVPAGYLPNEMERRLHLITRGKRWWAYKDGVHHVGVMPGNAQGIVDHRTRGPTARGLEDFQEPISVASGSMVKPLYLILCPPTIEVFMLEKLQWVTKPTLALEDVSYPEENAFDQVALSDDQINYLKSLAKPPPKDTNRQSEKPATKFRLNLGLKKDIGTFILLRGDAGAGKSLAAEAFAAHVKKPLLTMSSGELAGTAKDAELSLAKYFRLAKTWDCVLLFKNIDFILLREIRAGAVENHPLMNVFLNALDHFNGILFLTTNDHGLMDGSLWNRITTDLVLWPLSKEATRNIWRSLMRQAEEDDGIVCNVDAIIEFGDEIYEKRVWSARQLRNLFNMAVHMAEWEGRSGSGSRMGGEGVVKVEIDVRHIKQVQDLRGW